MQTQNRVIIIFLNLARMSGNIACIQDTLSSQAAFRPSASREQRYLAYNKYNRAC